MNLLGKIILELDVNPKSAQANYIHTLIFSFLKVKSFICLFYIHCLYISWSSVNADDWKKLRVLLTSITSRMYFFSIDDLPLQSVTIFYNLIGNTFIFYFIISWIHVHILKVKNERIWNGLFNINLFLQSIRWVYACYN